MALGFHATSGDVAKIQSEADTGSLRFSTKLFRDASPNDRV
jgi:hypothetical protein